MRATAVLLVAVLLAGCGASPSDQPAPIETPATSPAASSPVPSSPRATSPGPGAGAVPHRDEALARTGAVATKSEVCVHDADPDWAFDGTVVAIGRGEVTFDVGEVLAGTDTSATRTVLMGAPVTSGATETSPSYARGTRMLVSGSGDQAWGCGGTRYYDEEEAAAWRS